MSTSYGRRLTEIAATRPDDVELVIVARDGTETGISNARLERRANQIARFFDEQGVRRGSVVGLALPTCADHVYVTLAIWKLGATLLPLRHDLPPWELDRVLAIADPLLLVSDTHSVGCQVLTRADLAATENMASDPLPDRISEILYLGASSGSTGHPKLIVCPYPGVVADDPFAASWVSKRRLTTSPLYHVNGFIYTAPQLLEGSSVVVMERFDAARTVEVIERHEITMLVMVPTMLQRIAQLPDLDPKRFRSVERIVIGGAKTPDWVIDTWLTLVPAKALEFVYGSTERLGTVLMNGTEWAEHRGAAGRPADVELSIRDTAGNPVPTGDVGEIFMKPTDPHRRLFRYVGAPTPEPTHDGFRTIGDLGWLDDAGYLHIADRRSDMIITGGANVFPAEVEAALSEHPGVADQVVVPVPDAEWGHRVHAIVQPVDPAHPPTAGELREFCKGRLTAYKAPHTFEFVEALPRTEAGKLNRTALGLERADATPP
jgi:bile acid-coenzyme A ligase